jgi:hypothetical protein
MRSGRPRKVATNGVFNVLNRQEVTIDPNTGQAAYMDDWATDFPGGTFNGEAADGSWSPVTYEARTIIPGYGPPAGLGQLRDLRRAHGAGDEPDERPGVRHRQDWPDPPGDQGQPRTWHRLDPVLVRRAAGRRRQSGDEQPLTQCADSAPPRD